MSYWPDGTQVGRTMADFEALTSPGTRVAEFHPACDGVTDDYVDLQAAIVTAYGTGLLELQPGKTYLVGTALTITQSLRVFCYGATILKAAALANYAIIVSGADVEIHDLVVDGNLAAPTTSTFGCVQWTGARGKAYNVKANNSARHGFVVTGASCILDCYDCEASGHVWASGANGFQVSGSAVLRCWNCVADDNDADGFYYGLGSGTGCHLDGTASNNLGAGAKILCGGGTGGSFVTRNNKNFGLYGFGSAACTNWKFDYVADFECGRATGGEYTPNAAATSVELFGVSKFVINSFVSYHANGYGLALTRDTGTNVGCTECSILNGDIWGAGDPGIHVSGSSKKNTINATVRLCTVALSTGEQVPGVANDDNDITIVTEGCSFAAVNLDSGSRNRIRIRSTDTVQTTPYTALIRVRGAATGTCANNRIWLESVNPNSTAPNYVMTCDAAAAGNFVYCYEQPASSVGVLSDANGTNRVYLLSKTAL